MVYLNYSSKFARRMTIVFCIASMAGSISLIGLSIRSLIDTSFLSPAIATSYLNYAGYMLLFVGICTFTLTPMNLFSVYTNSNSMIVGSMWCTFLAACLSIIGGGTSYYVRMELQDGTIKLSMGDSLLHGFGNPSTPDVKPAWDELQQKFKCCGLNGTDDWVDSDWWHWMPTYPRDRAPLSCCLTCARVHEKFCLSFFEDEDLQENKTNLHLEQRICLKASEVCTSADDTIADESSCLARSVPPSDWPKQAYIHTDGCYNEVFRMLEHNSRRIFILGSCFSFILLMNAFNSFAILHFTEPNYSYSSVPLKP